MGFGSWLSDAFDSVKDFAGKAIGSVKDGIGTAIEKTTAFAKDAWNQGIKPAAVATWNNAIKPAGEFIGNTAANVYKDFRAGAGQFGNILSSPFTQIALGIAAIAAVIVLTKV